MLRGGWKLCVYSLPQPGSGVLLGFGTVDKAPEEQQAVLFVLKALCELPLPLEARKHVIAPAKRDACVGEAPVRPFKWKMLLHEHIWEGRDQACLFTENPWLSRIVGWSSLCCPLQSLAHSQQTTGPCQHLL